MSCYHDIVITNSPNSILLSDDYKLRRISCGQIRGRHCYAHYTPAPLSSNKNCCRFINSKRFRLDVRWRSSTINLTFATFTAILVIITAQNMKSNLFFYTAVDNSYDGPHLEDGKVTLEFVQQLLTRFKDQKKIHKKYAYRVSNRIYTWSCKPWRHLLNHFSRCRY